MIDKHGSNTYWVAICQLIYRKLQTMEPGDHWCGQLRLFWLELLAEWSSNPEIPGNVQLAAKGFVSGR